MKNKGITLVALIITIIILLILATVSIALVINNNVLDHAQHGVDKYSEEEELEQIKLAVASAMLKGNGFLDTENLNSELRDKFGAEAEAKPIGENWNFNGYKIEQDGKVGSILPAEYQQVEYIESSGTQYITLKFFPTESTELIINTKFTGINDLSDRTFWGIWDSNGTTIGFQFGVINASNLSPKLYIYYADGWHNISGDAVDMIIDDYTITIKNGKQLYNNQNYSNKTISQVNYSSQAKANGFPIIGCGYLSWENGLKKGNNIIKEIIWNDDVKCSHHFIPCYSTTTVTDINRKECSAGTVGLYDTVEGKFYTNQGTGAFGYGMEDGTYVAPTNN